jgi:hypothetical protein
MLIYFTAICNILQAIGIFYNHLVHFVLIWYIFPALVSCIKKNLATLLDCNVFHFLAAKSICHLKALFFVSNWFVITKQPEKKLTVFVAPENPVWVISCVLILLSAKLVKGGLYLHAYFSQQAHLTFQNCVKIFLCLKNEVKRRKRKSNI